MPLELDLILPQQIWGGRKWRWRPGHGHARQICPLSCVNRSNRSDSGSIRDRFDSSSPLETTTHPRSNGDFLNSPD
jgi:hypothetical protein